MYDFFKGKIAEITATYLVLEINDIGYLINIPMHTYENIKDLEHTKVYIHQVIKEDSNQLFGFHSKTERSVFLKLISVSGIGANTARIFLSSMNPEQIIEAIVNEDAKLLTTVKGIGLKTAQRTIVELKDKFKDVDVELLSASQVSGKGNARRIAAEAITALELLGFNKKAADKTVSSILKKEPEIAVEALIKQSLKVL